MSRHQELREFIQTWLGRDLTTVDAVAVPTSLALPAALREIYETFGAVRQLTTPHNILLAPSKLISDSGYCIFYDENQGVVSWAFREADRALEDPMVYQGTSLDDGYEWFSENMNLSAWIRVMTFWQLVNGGYEHVAFSSGIANAADSVQSHYPHVGSHANDSIRFYGKPRQLICIDGQAGMSSVWAAGGTADELAALSSTLDFDWDYSSDDDK